MPAFTSRVPDLQAVGPVVEVEVTVGASNERVLRAAGVTALPTLPVPAIIDTGAAMSILQQGLGARLGLHPVGVAQISTPLTASAACDAYRVRFVFPTGVVIETTAVEAPLDGQDVQCLIGRDVLAHAVFVYIGASDLFTLSF